MIIYESDKAKKIFIDIPHTTDFYARQAIINDNKNKVLTNIRDKSIPICKIHKYINPKNLYVFAYVKNPYQRLLLTFLHLNKDRSSVASFTKFVETELSTMTFDSSFEKDSVYYPQYRFVLGLDGEIYETDIIKSETVFNSEDIGLFNQYYNGSTIAIVNTIYKRDFELFGYSKFDVKNINKEKCANPECFYKKHTNPNNNGRGYCCRMCISSKAHGPACEKQDFSIKQ